MSACDDGLIKASAMTALTSRIAACQSSPRGTIWIKVPSTDRATSCWSALADKKLPPARARSSRRRLINRSDRLSISLPRLYSTVSCLGNHGRSTARLAIVGKPASTMTFVRGADMLGLPKSGSAGDSPLPRQSVKYLRIRVSKTAGSLSPTMTKVVRSGRYQRS